MPLSFLTDLEAAIARLPTEQVETLAAWLDEYLQTLHASASVFSTYDDEETRQR